MVDEAKEMKKGKGSRRRYSERLRYILCVSLISTSIPVL